MKRKFAMFATVLAVVVCCMALGCSPKQSVPAIDAPNSAINSLYANQAEFEAAHNTASADNPIFAKMADLPCTSCHGMNESQLYDQFKEDPNAIHVTRDVCITCHPYAAWPSELEAAYENIKDWNSYVGAGTQAHQDWVNSALQYTTGRPPMGDYEQECALCHTMHANTQTMYCTQCHNTDQGSENCMACHERILGEGMEFAGKTADEATSVLKERLEANGGHISSVMHAPVGWEELASIYQP